MAPSPVLVLTGPPGSGKSTVARLVAQRFERAVHLETDWFWSTIVSGFVPPWRPEADHQNRVVVRSFAAAAATLAAGGYAVVLDGIVGPWFLDVVRRQCARSGVEVRYVVLRPSREVALARVVARCADGDPARPAPLVEEGPVLHMWDQFVDLGAHEADVIDTSSLDPDQTVAMVMDRVTARVTGIASAP